MTPDDIAEVIVFAAGRRENVVIADTLIYPNHQVCTVPAFIAFPFAFPLLLFPCPYPCPKRSPHCAVISFASNRIPSILPSSAFPQSKHSALHAYVPTTPHWSFFHPYDPLTTYTSTPITNTNNMTAPPDPSPLFPSRLYRLVPHLSSGVQPSQPLDCNPSLHFRIPRFVQTLRLLTPRHKKNLIWSIF